MHGVCEGLPRRRRSIRFSHLELFEDRFSQSADHHRRENDDCNSHRVCKQRRAQVGRGGNLFCNFAIFGPLHDAGMTRHQVRAAEKQTYEGGGDDRVAVPLAIVVRHGEGECERDGAAKVCTHTPVELSEHTAHQSTTCSHVHLLECSTTNPADLRTKLRIGT